MLAKTASHTILFLAIVAIGLLMNPLPGVAAPGCTIGDTSGCKAVKPLAPQPPPGGGGSGGGGSGGGGSGGGNGGGSGGGSGGGGGAGGGNGGDGLPDCATVDVGHLCVSEPGPGGGGGGGGDAPVRPDPPTHIPESQ